MPDSLVGDTTIGPYVVERELGRGAFGVVFKVFHRDDPNTPIALKVVQSQGKIDKLLIEPALLAKLDHPCIVRVLDYFVHEDGKLAIALEFIPGEDLKDSIEQAGTFPPEAVRDLLVQIGGALAEAHAKGVVHRDLKPANILVDRTGFQPRYVLTDFGIGTEGGGIRSEKRVAGTYLFMAPEQLRGRAGPQSDLWALGVIAYRMLSGQYPFPGPGLEELTKQIALTSPPPPSKVTGQPIDSKLERVVLKLLDRSESERLGSANELLRELGYSGDSKDVLTGKRSVPPTTRISVRQRSLDESLRREIRKNYGWTIAWGIAYLLINSNLFGLVTIYGLFLFFRAHARLTGWRKTGLIALSFILVFTGIVAATYVSTWSNINIQQRILRLASGWLPTSFGVVVVSLFPLLIALISLVLPVLACNSYAKGNRLNRERVLVRAASLGNTPEQFLTLLRNELEYRYEDVGFHLRYAEALAANGDDRAAAIEARLLLVQDPYHFNGNLLLAQCHFRLGLFDDCETVCSDYLKVSGYCFEFAELKAQCQQRKAVDR